MNLNHILKAMLSGFGVAVALSACTGGGSDLAETGQVTNNVSPAGVVSVQAGKAVNVVASAKAKFDNVTSHKWTISQISGAAAASPPTLVDPDCAGATTTPGNPPKDNVLAHDGTSVCQTVIRVPSDTPTSEWLVENTARTAKGGASGRFTLKVTGISIPDSGFALSIPSLPQAFELNKTASLSATYTANVGVVFDTPVVYEWSQVSGDAVSIAGAGTNRMSFIPRRAGDYVFRVKATTMVAGKPISREGAVVAYVEAPQAVLTYQVSAGGLQAAQNNSTVSLTGTVTGDVPSSQLTYKWNQVEGPAATLFGDTSLTPQFSARTVGDYVFELAVTRNGPTPVVKTARTMVSVYAPQVNEPFFTINAGDVQTAALNSTVQLRAQVVNGTPAPQNLSYAWTQKSGPTQVTLSSGASLNASFIPTVAGTYEFDFTATAGTQSKTDSMTVVVAAPAEGYFSASAGPLQVSAVGSPVSLRGTVSGTVPSQQLQYNWVQVSGPSVNIVPDNELTAQFIPTEKGDYVFDLYVNRTGDFSTIQSSRTMVAVYSPTDAVNQPFFAVHAGDVQILGASTASVTLQGTVETGTPAPTNLVYKWTQISGPVLPLIANDNTRKATFEPAGPGLYVFEFSATTGNVMKTATTSVQILAPVAAPTP